MTMTGEIAAAYTTSELMVAAGSRELKDRQVVFAGPGAMKVGSASASSKLTAGWSVEAWDLEQHPVLRFAYKIPRGVPVGLRAGGVTLGLERPDLEDPPLGCSELQVRFRRLELLAGVHRPLTGRLVPRLQAGEAAAQDGELAPPLRVRHLPGGERRRRPLLGPGRRGREESEKEDGSGVQKSDTPSSFSGGVRPSAL